MKSPFPGMDPYLELYWQGFHGKLVYSAGDILNSRLPDDLIADTEERVDIETESEEFGVIFQDVRVTHAFDRDWKPEGSITGTLASYKLVAAGREAERAIRQSHHGGWITACHRDRIH